MTAEEVIDRLREMANPADLDGMARYGINVSNSLGGIAAPKLHAFAREIGRSHELALELWDSGIREARLIASLIDDPKQVTEEQMERWVADFDGWDIVDCCCGYLFDKTAFAYQKPFEWSTREEEFVKRAAFSLIAYLAVHDKKAPDDRFLAFLPIIKREANDGRNFVKKAVNWALRQIGKRSYRLNEAAIDIAREIRALNTTSARWIAADALRELTGEAVQHRLGVLV